MTTPFDVNRQPRIHRQPPLVPGALQANQAERLQWVSQSLTQELDQFMVHLERLNTLRERVAETLQLYYRLTGLQGGRGQEGIHELLFPQYWAHKPQEATRPAPDASMRVSIQIDVYPAHRWESPPLAGVAKSLPAPIQPIPLSPERLAQLPPPPLPERLREMLDRALSKPWDGDEAMHYYDEAGRDVTPEQIQHTLSVLPELEAALGKGMAKAPAGRYGAATDAYAPGGFEALATQRWDSKSSATGAYLHRLVETYQAYKAEYYGLERAIARDLYHRDPCSCIPPVRQEDALAYLEAKYAPSMEGLIWRTVRTSSPVMLDLDGDGKLAVTGRSTARDRVAGNGFVEAGSVRFDLDGDGQQERIEWMAGDGMLLDDRDGGAGRAASSDGVIDGTRLFGDEGGRYANGYEKLGRLDADGDGKLAGAELDGLKVWVDDGDARVEEGELKTLLELGISAIGAGMSEQRNAEGERLMRSTFVRHGKTQVSEDVWFAQG